MSISPALNDSLLRLEQDPTDVKALQEAFRMFHSIKGASVVMGFQPVNQLTHHLESLFEELRSKKRELDRPILDLTFRCLDELRDYHRDLRAQGAKRRRFVGAQGSGDRVSALDRRQVARKPVTSAIPPQTTTTSLPSSPPALQETPVDRTASDAHSVSGVR